MNTDYNYDTAVENNMIKTSLIRFNIFPVMCFLLSHTVNAAIQFEEVTQNVGMIYSGATYGASWGDVNGDGWPDLWVGNHNRKPSLYLNDGNGSFTDIVDRAWSGNPEDDTHGAAWADFDNDGDQDLVELVGASTNKDNTLCIGCGRAHLFINQDGVLTDKAKEYGLARAGLSRSPLWLDIDADGKLDLVSVNTRKKGHPSTLVFLQKNNRFIESNKETGFRDARFTRRDKLRAAYRNLKRFKFSTATSSLRTHGHLESAQLARMSSDEQLDMILFYSPSRIFALDDGEFEDMTSSFVFPQQNGVSDVAIEDFDGDGKNDLYIMKGPFLESDLVRVNANEIKGTLSGLRGSQQNTMTFRTKGDLEIRVEPTWRRLDTVYIGAGNNHPATRIFKLSPGDAAARSTEHSKLAEKNLGVSIIYDPDKALWIIRNFSKGTYADLVIKSSEPIEELQAIGFDRFRESGVDTILMRRGDKFVPRELSGEIGSATACYSVVAADFDNDMDIDLYMVCTGPVENLPNRLFENDGKGNFSLVANAGGASGSRLGRGDVAAIADFDRDGFMDIFVANGTDPAGPFVEQGPHQLFRNSGNRNSWLEIDLVGVKSNRDGIGATVVVEAGGTRQVREQRGGMHRITQNHQRLHFGLGANKKVDRLVVYWPSGIVQEIRNIDARKIVKIREQSGLSALEK